MSKPVRVDDEAKQELAEVLAWYEERRPGLGGRFLASFDRALFHLSTFPDAGSILPARRTDPPIRRFAVAGFPYQIVYLHLSQELRVIAVAYEHRAPGYWMSRLGGS